jgi:predicted nuclease with TOPRIM domain
MAEVSAELVFEVLESMQTRLTNIEGTIGEVRNELQAMRVHNVGMLTDIKNIYGATASIELRLDRLERRLDLTHEPAE